MRLLLARMLAYVSGVLVIVLVLLFAMLLN